jgi:gluconate 2-dehydrogenase alpha chain
MPDYSNSIADVCIVGVGGVGGILAKELGSAGLKVVAFERGAFLTKEDYAMRDSIKFTVRDSLNEWVRHEPVTFRPMPDQRAAVRYPTINAVGGQMLHWTGQSARFLPGDFKVFTNEIASGVAERAKADLTGYEIFDWPISYDDLEPYYERFEWEFGISDGTPNPFAGPRKRDCPLPPLRRSAKMNLFEAACKKLGYHPYQNAAGITSQTYKPAAPYDSLIEQRPGCAYCGHCNDYGCHVSSKATTMYTTVPVALKTGNVDLKTNTKVFRINTDDSGKATGVSYFTPEKEIKEQKARVVIVCGYTFENVRLLLLSESKGKHGLANSSGTVGKGLLGHGDVRTVGIYDDYIINCFIGPNSSGVRMEDFNGNNFDHAGLGFIRGASIGSSGDGAPIQRYDTTPPGMRKWGKDYKAYLAHYYTRSWEINTMSESLAHRDNMIDIDPDHKDEWGVPIPRVTFAFKQNEKKLHSYLAPISESIMRNAGASKVWTRLPPGGNRWAGGTRMGSDPKTSVVDGYSQSHDVPNLFIMGASTLPTLTGFPPTATIGAMAYRTADYIKTQKQWFQ